MPAQDTPQSLHGRVLLVDDDPSLRRLLSIRLEAAGHKVAAAASAREALSELPLFSPQVVITDLRMAEMDGLQLLVKLQSERPGLPVIIITAHGTIPDAIDATRQGAYDFVTKPIDNNKLLQLVADAVTTWGECLSDAKWREHIITCNRHMETLLDDARQIAPSDVNVLIQGESGTGKELLAQAIHLASARRKEPFVAINCSAMPEQLLESELFGHEKGAFTDAHQRREGLLRTAQGGTVFLDEIGDMPLPLQAKLLRVLEERQVRPVGSTHSIPIDVRVVSATHRDLDQAMADNDFREDLYYRLNVVCLDLPALAERREDIPLLAKHFLKQIAERTGSSSKVYSPEAMECLVSAQWPGNIRQLRNFVEQNVALCGASVISATQVRKALGKRADSLPSLDDARHDFTRNYLDQLLQMTSGNVSQAARLAERNRTDFYKLLARHDVNPSDYKA